MIKHSFSPARLRCLLMLLCAGPSLALAEDTAAPPPAPAPAPAPEQAAASPKPQVEKIDQTRYRIGKITLDTKHREIRLPAKVNMAEGLLEYLLVQEKGKIHESMLITDASPTHFNLAFMLLRYQPSTELFSPLDETGHRTGILPDVPLAVKASARLLIEVEWKDGEAKTQRKPINDWIQNRGNNSVMPPGPWLYTGSIVDGGRFVAELTGNIAAITNFQEAVINYPGADSGKDDVWYAFPKRVPAKDTEVTLIITPFFKKPAVPKP